MSPALFRDNIDDVRLERLDPPGGWRVTFRSGYPGMHHQAYVNGRLADYSDSTSQRVFCLPAHLPLEGRRPSGAPRRLVIAAVAAEDRCVDLSGLLPPDLAQPPWTHRLAVVSQPALPVGARLELLGDHATGQLDDRPIAAAVLNPEWAGLWGFGQDGFGSGPMGYDPGQAPGAGKGAFGAGGFGFDSGTTELSCVLPEEGLHQLVLRLVCPDGRSVEGPLEPVLSTPPPAPARSLTAVSYDIQTRVLSLEIQ